MPRLIDNRYHEGVDRKGVGDVPIRWRFEWAIVFLNNKENAHNLPEKDKGLDFLHI